MDHSFDAALNIFDHNIEEDDFESLKDELCVELKNDECMIKPM